MSEEAGVTITLEKIYESVLHTDTKVTRLESTVSQLVAVNHRLDAHAEVQDAHSERIRKVEAQIAAQWVIVSIVVVVIGAALVRAIVGG